MTNKEAIARIKEALDMAIKVLEQQPSGDAISRQEVLDALDKNKYSNEFCEEHCIDWSINLGMAHIVVNELKPVKLTRPTGRWISRWCGDIHFYVCSECSKEFSYDAETGIDITNYNYCPYCGAKMIEPQDKTKQGLAYADQDTLMSAT